MRNYTLITANEQIEEKGDLFLNPAIQVKASRLMRSNK